MKKILISVLTLISLHVFASEQLFCPTEGALQFILSSDNSYKAAKKSSWNGKNFGTKSNVTVKYALPQIPDYQVHQDPVFTQFSNVVTCIKADFDSNSNSHDVTDWAFNWQQTNANVVSSQDTAIATENPNPQAIYTPSGWNNCTSNQACLPGKLHAAFAGTLLITQNNITYSCPNVVIAQGGWSNMFLIVHNWWVFSNTNNGNNQLQCKYTDSNNQTQIAFFGLNDVSYGNTQDYTLEFDLNNSSYFTQAGYRSAILKNN